MSDFTRDLQAWTQAQFNRLYRNRGQRDLANDVNRLLRDRLPKPVEIKDGIGVIAEFLRTGGRIVPVPAIPITMDHGWLTGPYTATVIYTWSSIRALLVAQGYTIGESGEYASVVTRTANPTLYPENFSGLMRLLVQAFIGVGRALTEIIPTGWRAEPDWCGVVRSPAGVYWLANWGRRSTTMLGVKLAKLEIPEAYQGVADNLAAGLYTGGHEALAEATVLGSLTLSSVVDPDNRVVVFAPTDTDFTDIYEGIFGAFGGAGEQDWGWCGRYQKRGAIDEHLCGAVVLTFDSTPNALTLTKTFFRESVLTISFTEAGVPSGTIVESASGWIPKASPDDQYYYIEKFSSYNRAYVRDLPDGDHSTPSELGYILSCYLPSGSIGRLEAVGAFSETLTKDLIVNQVDWCDSVDVEGTITRERNYCQYQFASNTPDNIDTRTEYRTWVENWSLAGSGTPPDDYTNVSGTGSTDGRMVQWAGVDGDENPSLEANLDAIGLGVWSGTGEGVTIMVGGPGLVFFIAQSASRSYGNSFVAGMHLNGNYCDGTVYDTDIAYLILQVTNEWEDEGGNTHYFTPSTVESTVPDQVTVCYDSAAVAQSETSDIYLHLTDMIANTITPYGPLGVSYGSQINILGDIYATGLDPTGANTAGRFCGGA